MTATTATTTTKRRGKGQVKAKPQSAVILPETIAIDAQALKTGIRHVLPCVAHDSTRPVLQNVLWDARGVSFTLVACDGLHIAVARTPITGDAPRAVQLAQIEADDCEVIATRIDRYTRHPARVTFHAELADLVSTVHDSYYNATGIELNADEIGRRAKGNMKALPHDFIAQNSGRYPEWRRVFPKSDALRAVVRMQADQLLAIIPDVADYVRLAFYPDMLKATPAVKDSSGRWYDLAPSTLTSKDEDRRPLVAPVVLTRRSLAGGEKFTCDARLLRKWLTVMGSDDILQLHYYGEMTMLYIKCGEQDDSLIREYGIMPMTIR